MQIHYRFGYLFTMQYRNKIKFIAMNHCVDKKHITWNFSLVKLIFVLNMYKLQSSCGNHKRPLTPNPEGVTYPERVDCTRFNNNDDNNSTLSKTNVVKILYCWHECFKIQCLIGLHFWKSTSVRVSSVHLIFKNIKIHQNTILEFEFLFFIILEIDFYPKMPIFFFRKIQITQCLLKLKIEIHFSFIEKRKIRKLKKLTMQGRGKNLIFTHSQALPAING